MSSGRASHPAATPLAGNELLIQFVVLSALGWCPRCRRRRGHPDRSEGPHGILGGGSPRQSRIPSRYAASWQRKRGKPSIRRAALVLRL